MAEAARRLNITHGAVAQQIRALEAHVNAPLVARSGKTVHLTEAAHRILETSQKILDDVSSLAALAQAREIRGELRLGTGNTSLNRPVPKLLATLATRTPDLPFFIWAGLSTQFYPVVA